MDRFPFIGTRPPSEPVSLTASSELRAVVLSSEPVDPKENPRNESSTQTSGDIGFLSPIESSSDRNWRRSYPIHTQSEEHDLRQTKEDEKPEDVSRGRNENGRRRGRIVAKPIQSERNECSEEPGDDEIQYHRYADD